MFGTKGADDREFIRNLPKYIRYWFILEFYLPLVFGGIGILSFIVLKLFFKGWGN
jgi:hypothetical protein